jgi:signal transduction histidine kinase
MTAGRVLGLDRAVAASPPARRQRAAGDPAARQPQTRALLQFTAAALVVLAVFALLGAFASERVARRQAISDAQLVTQVLARTVIEPSLEDGLVSGNPGAVWRLDKLVVDKIAGQSVVRVKLWTPDGQIVYSDDHRAIGARYPLGPSERAALESGTVDAEVSDLSKSENELDRHLGEMLEVYMAVRTPGGEPLLFETYSTYSAVSERAARIFWPIALVTVGTLLLLELVQIPLAWRTARRLGQLQRDREQLLHKAIVSSRIERRRIAADLHDGVVQDLAAVSFSLAGAAARTRHGRTESQSDALMDASAAVRGAIRSLRSLLVDIYPPSLHRSGLAATLQDLAAPLTGRGLAVEVDLPADLRPSEPDAELVYRVAQEALRNVAAHAAACSVALQVTAEASLLTLTIADDGRGFDVTATERSAEPGHVGLALLRDLAADAGAVLTMDSAPGQGTRLQLEVPQ